MTYVRNPTEAAQRAGIDLGELTTAVSQLVKADESVMLTGSVAEGFGNSRSDVDLFVIGGGDSNRRLEVARHAGRLVEIDRMSTDEVLEIARIVNRMEVSSVGLWATSRSVYERYYRIAIGIVLSVGTSSALKDTQTSLFSVERCCDVYARYCAMRSRDCLDLLLFEELPRATVARWAFEYALDAKLALYGQGFPSPKWRFEKLRRLPDKCTDLWVDGWRLKASTGDLKAYADGVRAFVHSLDLPKIDPPPPHERLLVRKAGSKVWRMAGAAWIVVDETRSLRLGGVEEAVLDAVSSERAVSETSIIDSCSAVAGEYECARSIAWLRFQGVLLRPVRSVQREGSVHV